MSQASFYRWFNRFSETNDQVEDEPRSREPKSACKKKNIQEVQRLVMQDRRMSVRMISEAAGIGIGTVDTILTEDLKLHKVCAKFDAKILSENHRQFRVVVPPRQCLMPQVNAGDHLDGQQEYEINTTLNLHP